MKCFKGAKEGTAAGVHGKGMVVLILLRWIPLRQEMSAWLCRVAKKGRKMP